MNPFCRFVLVLRHYHDVIFVQTMTINFRFWCFFSMVRLSAIIPFNLSPMFPLLPTLFAQRRLIPSLLL